MQQYQYRTGKNLVMGLFMAVCAVGSALSWFGDGGFFSGAGILLFAGCSWLLMRLAISDEPALSFDARSLMIRSTFKKVRLEWAQLLDLSVRVIRLRYWGIIPISKQEILSVKYSTDGGGSSKVHLSLGTVRLPPGGAQLLLAQLNGAWIAAVGEAGVAMAGAGKQGWGAERRAAKVAAIDESTDQGSDFDPDAVIARYLASKAQAGEANSAATPTLAGASPPQPVRPTFGRRVA